jgi:methionine-rich copper-binding protein CopC
MRSVPATAHRWLTRTAVIFVLAGVGLTFPASPAHAHGQLAVSKPLANTIVNTPLERIELYFTERPASHAYFTVTAPGGGRVDNGWSGGQPIRLDKPVQEYSLVNGKWEPHLYHTGFPATVPVAHWPGKGDYVASYLSVASDGEAVKGSVKFHYNGPATPAPAGWTPPTNGPDPNLLAQTSHGDKPDAPGATTGPAPGGVDDPDNTAEAAPQPQGSVAVWLLPAGLVLSTALIIGHAARKPPLPARPRGARTRRPPRDRP